MLRNLLLASALAVPALGHAATETVLYSFQGGADGATPHSRLLADNAGDLYGTTLAGGGSATCDGGCGTVYKLTPAGGGTYTESVLHVFIGGTDGAKPVGPLSQDGSGNFYGTTYEGGGDTTFGPNGCGTIFEITAGGTYSVVHAFQCATEGDQPVSALLYGGGNFYGSASAGSNRTGEGGTLFVLTPGAGGTWTFAVVDRFKPQGIYAPIGDLVFGADGKLYSEAAGGRYVSGVFTAGNVFSANPANLKDGQWFKQPITNFFESSGGSEPEGGLLQEAAGSLLGSTFGGGDPSYGTVFRLTKPSSYPRIPWQRAVLYAFTASDPGNPFGRPIEDASGDIFGTGENGGTSGAGGVWELRPVDDGYTETTLYSFTGGTDGGNPFSGLIADTSGNLYGTTAAGGAGYGVVFRVAP